MSSKFEAALKSTLNDQIAITENGAVGFKTSGKALCDINFAVSSLRGAEESKILKMWQEAYAEDPVVAIKWLFMLRDIRGNGMGERRTFRVILKELAAMHSDIVEKLVPIIADYGRYDALWELSETPVWNAVIDLVAKQLADDMKAKDAGKPITLLAKWLPSCNTSSAKTKELAVKIRRALGMDEKTYRKTLSSLRSYGNVLEVKLSAKEWGDVNYDAVPSQANLKYKNAFLKNDEARRREWLGKLEKGEAKINASTSFPCDIVYRYGRGGGIDQTLEAMWKALPNYVSDLKTGSTIVVADGSGSMTTPVGGGNMSALAVANSLAIYFAERLPGEFKDKYITFSMNPQYVDMSKAKSLAEKLRIAYQHSEVANTNIKAVFELLLATAKRNNLKQEDIPANVLVVSDMEFDGCTSFSGDNNGYGWYNTSRFEDSAKKSSLFEGIKKEWANAGYVLPKLIFWNVNSRTNTVPLQQNEMGITLVSGFSPAISKMAFSMKLDPYEAILEALNCDRYTRIAKIVTGLV